MDSKWFAKGFAECLANGLAKYDETTRTVFLPRFMRHNGPANPNVVKNWGKMFNELPDGGLKPEIYQAIYECCKGLGEGFAKVFLEVFEEPSVKGMRNQEQEQEQEQIDTSFQSVSCPEVKNTSAPAPAVILSFPLVKGGDEFGVTQRDLDQWQDAYPAVDVPGELRRCLQWNIDNPKRRKTKGGIRNHISTWLAKVQDRGGAPPRATGRNGGRPPVRSVRDAMILQGEEIARALNEDDERRKQQQVGPERREASGVLLEHPVPGGWICQ